MPFTDVAAALTIIATIVGSTVKVMIKLNAMDRELLELRRLFSAQDERITRIERKLDIE
jgi:hypothetical protein